jgi:hypothetical protein
MRRLFDWMIIAIVFGFFLTGTAMLLYRGGPP